MAMKYDKMVSINREKSQEKIAFAKRTIDEMLERKEKVTIAALAKYTGLSKGFFYSNSEVRDAVNKALLQQGACYNPKQVIVDQVMSGKITTLKKMLSLQKKTIKQLEIQNQELQEENRSLKKELEILRNN
ncbi:hypothetical protein CLOM621_07004 [Clostridium sp. M62/1]|nr:hypothetical protein CLOM621_07004 [Clostridium sp. M62/1]